MTSVTIGNSVISIGGSAFAYCSRLTNVTIPNSVAEIGSYAFEYCSSLTSVTIPNSVTSIATTAFSNCNNAKELIYAEGTKTVLQTGLTSITSVVIPNSVTSIGSSAFSDCSRLTSIKVHWKIPLSINASVWSDVDKQKCMLYVPEGTRAVYCSAPVWMNFVNIEEFSDEPVEEIYLTVMGVNGVILQQAVEMEKTY